MRSIIAAFVLFLSSGVSGQVPHTFQNGQAADADKVNENFEYVLENANGGCSATQQDSSVLITCADGTSGVIAGAGTVVIVPEGAVGETPNIEVSVGEIFVVDADDVVLGKFQSVISTGRYMVQLPWMSPDGSTSGESYATINNEGTQVTVSPLDDDIFSYASYFVYTSNDCSGQPYVAGGESFIASHLLYSADDGYYVSGDILSYNFLSRSSKGLQNSRSQVGDGICTVKEQVTPAAVPITYTFPEELVNAAYPVRLKQF